MWELSSTMNETITHIDKRFRARFNIPRLLTLPFVLLMLFVFLVPFLALIRISVSERSMVDAYVPGTWSIKSYQMQLTNELFWDVFITTTEMAIIASVTTVAIGLFYAYAIWRADGRLRTILLLAMVLPLLISLVVKIFSLMILLAPKGSINDFLISAGLAGEPVQLMNNMFGVIVALTYTTVAYAALPIYAVLYEMNLETLEAARDLGAGKIRSFYEVVIPQVIPGIIVASVLSFVWNFGAYASPSLLGSGTERTLGVETQYYINRFRWVDSAAVSVIMLVVIIVCTIALLQVLGRKGGGMGDVT